MLDSKLQEARATAQKIIKELKAYADHPVDNSIDPQALVNRVVSYMQTLEGRMGYLEDTVANQRERFYEHTDNGHLPPIKGREQMSKALKGLGLSEEYEPAPKKVVYANTKHGPIAIIGKDVDI